MKALILFIFSCFSVLGNTFTDAYWQQVDMPTNIYQAHGTCMVKSPLGTNYLFVSTRENPPGYGYIIRYQMDNISNYSVINCETNYHVQIPSCISLSNQVYVLWSVAPNSFIWGIMHINPDTLATNDICSNLSTNNWCTSLGSMIPDGTNLFVVCNYVIEKYSTSGTLLASNEWYNPTNVLFGNSAHSAGWDGSSIVVTGNHPNNNYMQTVLYVSPSDLSYSNWIVDATNTVPMSISPVFTDDLAADSNYEYFGDESQNGIVWVTRKSDGATFAIKTSQPPTPLQGSPCWGVLNDGDNIWGEWGAGFLTMFHKSDIATGLVKVDTYSLRTNAAWLNEMVVNSNVVPRVYYCTTFNGYNDGVGPMHVFRFSSPDFFTSTWSFTNGRTQIPLSLFQIK